MFFKAFNRYVLGMTPADLIKNTKNKRAPRYTSYPPANHFNELIGVDHHAQWLSTVKPYSAVSMYVHIPYCRHLCWFCACRTQAVKRDSVLNRYIVALVNEVRQIGQHLDSDAVIHSIHLGGGTPLVLNSSQLTEVFSVITETFNLSKNIEISFEIDPSYSSIESIDTAVSLGMSRASLGVQDFSLKVQKAIGREQSFKTTEAVINRLRQLGVTSINLDLVYGLPNQTIRSFTDTLEKVIQLRPERIALFGYAHVPWMSRRQILINNKDIPDESLRENIYNLACRKLITNGYYPVGIDHFVRRGDSMLQALDSGSIKRNFQGYTCDTAPTLIGVGASAISKFEQGYTQNASRTKIYEDHIDEGNLATSRGHELSPQDKVRSYIIERLMCHLPISIVTLNRLFGHEADEVINEIRFNTERLGLTRVEHEIYHIKKENRALVRLIAQAFDQYKGFRSHSLVI
ncbi:MAG: oxygen-independent coproporphyrinogen III oxidase [Burkholderiales bacterium]|nr:oxygen-independent coproporphyrinogen III oxidase [Burkholderiales bacterium]